MYEVVSYMITYIRCSRVQQYCFGGDQKAAVDKNWFHSVRESMQHVSTVLTC